jgi:MHS family proline/betaine transporter-like MFS transporter
MVAVMPADAIVIDRRNIGAALIGNLLEWYDFAVYAFMAGLIGKNFFPSSDPLGSLLASFAVFGVGFLARPIGSIVIGRFGDVRGRKPALVVTILTMAVGTVMIGIVPSYASIGIAAPILVLVARLLQGFSTGGEAGNSMAFMVEWAPDGQRGYYGGLQQCSSAAGFLLGSGIAAATSSLLDPATMLDWGWRVPFLLGALIGPVGVYLRRHSEETPAFREVTQTMRTAPHGAGETPVALAVRAFGFTILWTVVYYIFLTFMPSFTANYAKLSGSDALWSNTLGLLALVVSAPLMGRLSDRIGRKPLLLAGCVLFFVVTYPAFSLMLSGPPLFVIILLQMVFGVLIGMIAGTSPTAISEIFPTRIRTTWMSIGYTLAVALFGGFAPFIATWLIRETGSPIAPVYYVMAAAVVSGVVIARMRETAHLPLR